MTETAHTPDPSDATPTEAPQSAPTTEIIETEVALPKPVPAPQASKEMGELRAHTRTLLEDVQRSPSFPEATGDLDQLQVQSVDLATLLDSIKRSNRSLASALAIVTSVNDMGIPSTERPFDVGADLVPLAVYQINLRRKADKPISIGEKRMLNTYAKFHKGNVRFPEWYVASNTLMQTSSHSEKLPGPSEYLVISPKAAEPSAPKRAELDRLDELIYQLRQSKADEEGPGGDKTHKAIRERDKLISELDGMLNKAGDVDPRRVKGCRTGVSLSAQAAPEVVQSLLRLRAGVGSLIEQLADSEGANKEPIPVEVVEFVTDQKEGAPVSVDRIVSFALDASPALNPEHRLENLSFLLKEYNQIHSSLLEAFRSWSGQTITSEPNGRPVFRELETELTSIFPGGAERSREIMLKLDEIDDPAIQAQLPPLLTTQTLARSTSHSNLETFLDKPNNLQLLGLALKHLVHGDEQTFELIQDTLKRGTARPVCELGARLRGYLDSRDLGSLTKLFDRELEKMTSSEQYSSFTSKACALHALMTASEDEGVRKGLKGRLKNLELVNELASSLNEGMGRDKSPAAKFVEMVRAKVARRFSNDLSDYWGQRELVKEWKQSIQDHLSLLKHPETWLGIPPNQVLFNGYLLHGDPGAGKSFLVECMANELEIPLVTISREEMAEAFKKAEDAKGSEIEDTLSSFMADKIKRAEADKERSGAKACMIFIDEMEAEFLKRDPQTSPRAELTRTNIMLRVLEKLIKKHPDIIFVGATNHIDLVDPAALRRGRFGIPLEVKMPEKGDVEDILEGTFLRLGIQVGDEIKENQEFQGLVEQCIHMSPLAIQQTVNNAIALERVRASKHDIDLTSDLFRHLGERIEVTKKRSYNPKVDAADPTPH